MIALLSVSDKRGIVEFARGLASLGWEILSTGGTHKLLLENGIKVREVAEFTGSPEMFDGRVKTLHPRIHGGILYKREKHEHIRQAKEYEIGAIDLVCVNLYPFKQTIQRTSDFGEIIENIDIGGPAMLRAAAKNFASVYVVSDPRDYEHVLAVLRGETAANLALNSADNPRQSMQNDLNSPVNSSDSPLCSGPNLAMNSDRSRSINQRLNSAQIHDEKIAVSHQIYPEFSSQNGPCDLNSPQNQGLEFRRELMIRAFEHTACYDAMIANYMNERFCGGFGASKIIVGRKVFDTRYGENPHQKGALYEFESFFSTNFRALKGESSFNNLTDIHAATMLATSFGDAPCVAICKHANPCGFALKNTEFESYEAALKCDSISAYGGVVAINGTLDADLARKMREIFTEVIIAANVTDEALAVFSDKKRMKIFTHDASRLKRAGEKFDFKHIDGGFVFQQRDEIGANELENARLVTQSAANSGEFTDLQIAWKIAALTKSNCVAYVKNAALVAIGMGMTSRVDAARAAVAKARDMGANLRGCVLASEAFFPFRDSIDIAASVGVRAIVQPGGSIRDNEVIAAADEHDIAMYFTGVRHFLH